MPILLSQMKYPLCQADLTTLHTRLCNIAACKNTANCLLPYGGYNIIFMGDFAQLLPIGGHSLFSSYIDYWHGMIQKVIFLDNAHRFKDDPEWGEILLRIRLGTYTESDIIEINKRLITSHNPLPIENHGTNNLTYACELNAQRNEICNAIFMKHLQQTHPKINQPQLPPNHTFIIKGKLKWPNGHNINKNFHQWILNTCGDADLCTTTRKPVDPVSKIYVGMPIMFLDNTHINLKIANGTTGTVEQIYVKNNHSISWENWNDYKVNTIDIENVTGVLVKIQLHHNKIQKVLVKPRTMQISIALNIIPTTEEHTNNITGTLKPKQKLYMQIRQLPFISNIATTGHKLQSASKDMLIVYKWPILNNSKGKHASWIYIILSCVRTCKGLFLMEPLEITPAICHPSQIFLKEEQRLHQLEQKTLETFYNIFNNTQ